MKESEIQASIMKALGAHERVAWAMVITTGVFRVKGGYITTGHYMTEHCKATTGMSDIVGQLTDGKFFSIETKRPKEKPTKEQYDFMGLVAFNHGLSGWCVDVDGALKIIEGEK